MLTLRVCGFHKKFVQFGSVCMTLNMNSSRKQRSMTRVAICKRSQLEKFAVCRQ